LHVSHAITRCVTFGIDGVRPHICIPPAKRVPPCGTWQRDGRRSGLTPVYGPDAAAHRQINLSKSWKCNIAVILVIPHSHKTCLSLCWPAGRDKPLSRQHKGVDWSQLWESATSTSSDMLSTAGNLLWRSLTCQWMNESEPHLKVALAEGEPGFW
jgi:hypothetical protein